MKRAKSAQQTRIAASNSGKILDAALSHFARFGFTGARLDQIAAQADMSKPNLLYYFRSKDALYKAVLRRTLDNWLEALHDFDAKSDPETALRAFIGTKLAFSRDRPEESRLFAMEILQGAQMLKESIKGDLAAMVEDKASTIRSWIAAGKLKPVDPYHLIFMVWATTQHYADFGAQIELLTGKDLSNPRFYETVEQSLMTVFVKGLLPSR